MVGASGSVFGFIGLYIADLVLNFETIEWPVFQLAIMMVCVAVSMALQVRGCAVESWQQCF